MPNANTIARAAGLPGATQGVSSTAEAYYDDNQTTAVDAIVAVPILQLKRKSFIVRASGRAFAATATNLTINLDAGDSTTIASNTTIATSGAIALDTDGTILGWFLEATCMFNETNSKLQGLFKGYVNNTAVAQVVNVESVEDLAAGGVMYFKVTFTMSASNAGNGTVCDQLEVDVL
jgi:uncharacterized membrane protein